MILKRQKAKGKRQKLKVSQEKRRISETGNPTGIIYN
jgi:hypothetical protein